MICGKMLDNFGYKHVVDTDLMEEDCIPTYIKQRNEATLKNMMKPNAFKKDTPILMNAP